MTNPLVIDTEELPDAARAWLAARCRVETCGPTEPHFHHLLPQADGLVVRTYTTVDRGLLDLAPRLRVVGRAGVGLDNVDVAACRERGVDVVYTPEANASSVAELVFGWLLDVVRPREALTMAISQEAWNARRKELEGDKELGEMRLGILGLGRVGRRVARFGNALGMEVIYHDLRPIPEAEREGARPVSPTELLSTAEILTVHVDGRLQNRKLLGPEAFERVLPELLFVNASRGFVVDSEALAGYLRAHPKSRALVDVHHPEPFPADYPLLGLSNATLLPHIGAATKSAKQRMAQVVEDVWRVLQRQPPRWPAP